jgi:hypothetical protein
MPQRAWLLAALGAVVVTSGARPALAQNPEPPNAPAQLAVSDNGVRLSYAGRTLLEGTVVGQGEPLRVS